MQKVVQMTDQNTGKVIHRIVSQQEAQPEKRPRQIECLQLKNAPYAHVCIGVVATPYVESLHGTTSAVPHQRRLGDTVQQQITGCGPDVTAQRRRRRDPP
eukprot:scaffold3394_cov385-Prasinococcus_capsulatus_cf.AAC.7